jgi:catechol 2,3-dioxygenase-like lactoylglutathione lyase family enzyme
MQLIDHLSIAVRDLGLAQHFYSAVLAPIGAHAVFVRDDAIGFGDRNRPDDDNHSYMSIYLSSQAAPDPRRHTCFRAQTRQAVDDFYAAGIAAGGTDAGAPGLRNYHPHYYAAFLLDPDGNKLEAVCHRAPSSAE